MRGGWYYYLFIERYHWDIGGCTVHGQWYDEIRVRALAGRQGYAEHYVKSPSLLLRLGRLARTEWGTFV